jgi:hypothetical protein
MIRFVTVFVTNRSHGLHWHAFEVRCYSSVEAYGGLLLAMRQVLLNETELAFCRRTGDQREHGGSWIRSSVRTRSRYRIHHFRRERRRSYFTACALAGIVWLAGLFAFHHHERSAPKSAVGELVLGVLAGLILQVGTVLVVRWWKSLPKLLNRTEEEVHSKLSNDIREEISEALEGIKFDTLDEAALAIRLNQIYVHTLSVENTNWRSIAIDFRKSIRDVQVNFAAARLEQLAHIEDLRIGALRYFTDPARNLSLLTSVALKNKGACNRTILQIIGHHPRATARGQGPSDHSIF